ncbi:MAG: S8 family serine peptidase [Planctomycetia bacterium]|nr:S8 family serine peptidase [Planctomycetia bacterium]
MQRRRTFYLFLAALIAFSTLACGDDPPTTQLPHLTTTGVNPVWSAGYSGAGVVVGIVDDSMYMDHSYYSTRVVGDACRFFEYDIYTDSLSTTIGSNPRALDDTHGTSVAGCVAAYGTTNVDYGFLSTPLIAPAYGASLVGLGTDLMSPSIAAALRYGNDTIDIKNNSYGMGTGFGTVLGSLGNFFDGLDGMNAALAIREATESNVILVYSAGNSRDGRDNGGNILPNAKDANKKGFQAHPDTIVVGALGGWSYDDTYDTYSSFSCYGSNVFISALGTRIPTSAVALSTKGDTLEASSVYTTVFGGTSAAAPVASGIMALAVEAIKDNPNVSEMTPRLMKHLLVQTSDKIDPGATDEYTAWTTNAAGNAFSPTYGFGRINAEKLVSAAVTTLDVSPQSRLTVEWELTTTGGSVDFTRLDDDVYAYAQADLMPETTSGTDSSLVRVSNFDAVSMAPIVVSGPVLCSTMQYLFDPDAASLTPPVGSTILAAEATPVAQIEFRATFTEDSFADLEIQPLEEMALTIGIDAPYLGDLRIEVVSPSNTESILCFEDNEANDTALEDDELFWTFSSNAFWGESPVGEWEVRVMDMFGEADLGMFSLITSFYMGEVMSADNAVPEPGTYVLMIMGAGFLGVTCLWRRRSAA